MTSLIWSVSSWNSILNQILSTFSLKSFYTSRQENMVMVRRGCFFLYNMFACTSDKGQSFKCFVNRGGWRWYNIRKNQKQIYLKTSLIRLLCTFIRERTWDNLIYSASNHFCTASHSNFFLKHYICFDFNDSKVLEY